MDSPKGDPHTQTQGSNNSQIAENGFPEGRPEHLNAGGLPWLHDASELKMSILLCSGGPLVDKNHQLYEGVLKVASRLIRFLQAIERVNLLTDFEYQHRQNSYSRKCRLVLVKMEVLVPSHCQRHPQSHLPNFRPTQISRTL